MKRKIGNISMRCMPIVLASLLAINNAAADDDERRVKVRGESTGMFVRVDPVAFPPGPIVNDTTITGNFTVTMGDAIRTGRFAFPHLLVVNLEFPPPPSDPSEPPPPPIFLDGHVTGAAVWIFDDGVVCDGPVSGDFDETGGNLLSKAKLDCNDGTRLRLRIRDVDVNPGISVVSEIKGKWIIPDHDD